MSQNQTFLVALGNEAATANLMADLALLIGPGDVITLSGDLGAGKTAAARAMIRYLAGDAALEVPSPTFTLVQGYDLPSFQLLHADLYRVNDPNELEEIAPALGRIVVSWWPIARFDELVAWLKSLPPKPWRNAAVNKLVFELVGATEYPEKVSQLIPLVDPETKQNDAIEKIGRAWLRKDHAAAEAWLATTKLPEDRRQKLLKSAK